MSTPAISLAIFFGISIAGYLLFRPDIGYYWVFIKGKKFTEKVIKEDILKILYHTEYNEETLSLRELEKSLNKSHSKLADILSVLINSYLIVKRNDVISLTKEGRDYALKIIRAHRLYEKYLSEKTGYDKLDWHDMAEVMEHKLSYEDVDNLSSQLGSPYFDPHGDPIPTKSGDMISQRGIPLYDLPENTFGRIIHIEDEPEIVYKQILAEDLHIGSQVRIIASNKISVKFYCEGKEFVLANKVAANLTVVELSKEEKSDADIIRMSALNENEIGIVEGISKECRGASRRRLLDLGFVPGTEISIGLVSPMKDPRAYRMRSTDIALRNEQASFILLKRISKKAII